MNCPFCNEKMISGDIINNDRQPLKWKGDNEKWSPIDYISSKGALWYVEETFTTRYPAFYCEKCKKIIMDADPS